MASVIDICNLALGHLGDTATISSISPPEGSAQAEHCARFYPIARDALLELHAWGFATKRVALASLGSGWPEWQYCYALPSDALNVLAVLPPNATDDYSVGINYSYSQTGNPLSGGGIYQPQPFNCETLEDGTVVVYTNQADAVLRYTAYVEDTTVFSPLFVVTLSWLLASYLAGPVIKGEQGSAESKRCLLMSQQMLAKAAASDANQRRTVVSQQTPWMVGR